MLLNAFVMFLNVFFCACSLLEELGVGKKALMHMLRALSGRIPFARVLSLTPNRRQDVNKVAKQKGKEKEKGKWQKKTTK